MVTIQTSAQAEPMVLPAILFTDDRGTPSPPRSTGNATRPDTGLPALLLSGDPPVAVAPEPAMAAGTASPAPVAAGETPTLWLGAPDPHMVCAQWNLPAERIAEAAAQSESPLELRIVAETPAATCIVEQPLEPAATESFVAVPQAHAPYHAELGVRNREGEWEVLAVSASTTTPSEAPGADLSYTEGVWSAPAVEPWFAGASPAPLVAPASAAPPPPVPPPAGPAVGRTRPPSRSAMLHILALSQEEHWGEVFASHSLAGQRRTDGREEGEDVGFGPEDEQAADHLSSGTLAGGPGADSGQSGLPSSLSPARPLPGRKFWFRVNAEVVLYGSTEPDATVSIGSHPVKLRPDGSFSFRFALPDGEFPLPVVAVAAGGHDGRAATVTFRRTTQTTGIVGLHPQDPALQPPHPENAL